MAKVAGYYRHRGVYRIHGWEELGLDVLREASAFVAFSLSFFPSFFHTLAGRRRASELNSVQDC